MKLFNDYELSQTSLYSICIHPFPAELILSLECWALLIATIRQSGFAEDMTRYVGCYRDSRYRAVCLPVNESMSGNACRVLSADCWLV
jgi:hypothetical protein